LITSLKVTSDSFPSRDLRSEVSTNSFLSREKISWRYGLKSRPVCPLPGDPHDFLTEIDKIIAESGGARCQFRPFQELPEASSADSRRAFPRVTICGIFTRVLERYVQVSGHKTKKPEFEVLRVRFESDFAQFIGNTTAVALSPWLPQQCRQGEDKFM
jgi:hypothetical protein